MSKTVKQVEPVTEESKFQGVFHVNVDKTVEMIKKELAQNQQVQLVSKQSQISRVGMIMKRVEEDCKAKILKMRTDYKTDTDKDREFNVLYFKALFGRGE